MQIGGLAKNSLIDFPGKLSSVIFFSGCNFDCPYCHNPDLVSGCSPYPGAINFNEVCKFLETRQNFLDGVVISGGEPTLQADLIEVCTQIKDLGYPIKLDTNGSRPGVLRRLVNEGLVDYIAMDLKTDPYLYNTYIKSHCDPDPIFASIQLIMNAGVDYEFRTTCVKPIVTRQTVERICRRIQGAQLYVLQHFRKNVVLHPEFFQDCDYEYCDEELLQLKALAEQWVEKCIVR
ncbi:MAG: anaerobic ribonucleoside-triphosphate reductase activating protein [Deltaproteobacteria bacterium]|jgi:pyruvate formate lyase activating enzyme|nr:anaerobic ribonucleoside-triphosphate reductase activating protein [Deltaproteobacteria bacterium]